MDRIGEGNPQPEESSDGFEKYLDRQSDWLERTKGNLMVTATVIASMSFQVMVTPPGGVWQDDKCTTVGTKEICKKVGTAVFAHEESKRVPYLGMVISSTVSFTTSMSFILLAISGFRLRNRFIMAILVIFMLAAVICLSAAFFFAIALVQSENGMVLVILLCYVVFWFLFVVLVGVIHLVKFITWAIRCCFGHPRRSSRRRLPLAPSSAN